MSGRTIGNFILMTVICIVVFWMFMAIHGAHAATMDAGMNVLSPYIIGDTSSAGM